MIDIQRLGGRSSWAWVSRIRALSRPLKFFTKIRVKHNSRKGPKWVYHLYSSKYTDYLCSLESVEILENLVAVPSLPRINRREPCKILFRFVRRKAKHKS